MLLLNLSVMKCTVWLLCECRIPMCACNNLLKLFRCSQKGMRRSGSVARQRKITVMRPKTQSSILPATPCPCSSDQITPMRTVSQASRHFILLKVMETMDSQHDCLSLLLSPLAVKAKVLN